MSLKKHLLYIFLFFFLFLILENAVFAASVSFENGIITVSGNGIIVKSGSYDWEVYSDVATDVVISNGITSLPDDAFISLKNVSSFEIPGSVESIGLHAIGYIYENGEYFLLDKIIIRGASGSAAEKYASDNGIIFEEIKKEENNNPSGTLNGSTSWEINNDGVLFINGSGNTPNFPDGESVPWINFYKDQGKNHITKVIIGDEIDSIGNYFFSTDNDIISVEIGNSLVKIGDYSFCGCKFLESINLKNVSIIGNYSFNGLKKLSDISSTSFESIGNYSFSETNIREVSFSDLCTKIPDYAFYNCSMLEKVNCSSVKQVGNYSFYCCSLLSSIDTEKINSVGNYSFYKCISLESFNGSLDSLGEASFAQSGLVKISFTGSLNIIPCCSFEGCSNLSSVVFNDKIISISERAFSTCQSLESVRLTQNIKEISDFSIGYYHVSGEMIDDVYSKYKSFDFTIYGPDPSIAKQYAEKNEFTFISSGSVASDSGKINDTSTWSIKLPSGLLTIDGSGILPDYASPDEAPWSIYNSKIRAVVISGVKNIGSYSFYGLSDLSLLNFSNSVTSIGDYAFYGTSISSLNLTKNISEIGTSSFENCNQITQLTFPASLTSIGERAFKGLDLVKSVYVSEKVIFLGDESIGYDETGLKINGFLIKGANGTIAQNYASENGFQYRIDGYQTVIDTQTGSTITMICGEDDNFTFSAECIGKSLAPNLFIKDDKYLICYDPIICNNGAQTQLSSEATVSIPVPGDINYLTSNVYILHDYNNIELINSEIIDNYYVFNVSNLERIIISNSSFDDIHLIKVSYVFADGTSALDDNIYYAENGASYTIDAKDIDGYAAESNEKNGVINSADIDLIFTYTASEDTSSIQSDTTNREELVTSDSIDEGSVPKYVIIEIVLIILLLIAIIILLIILINKRNINKIIEKSDKMAAADKFADTMVIDEKSKAIDISKLFEPEAAAFSIDSSAVITGPTINKLTVNKAAVEKHFVKGFKPKARKRI